MSIRIRVNSIELATDAGSVKHEFRGPLTVLTGPVGVGKSTLFELLKYAVGGSARIAPVARDHISGVRVEIEIARERLLLTRRLGKEGNVVSAHDVLSDTPMGTFPVNIPKGEDSSLSISSILLRLMGLPTDVFSTSKSRSSRITFNSVWSFVYVEQREIDRSVARNTDNYAEPSRKATFELLFGLTDPAVLELKKLEREAGDVRVEAAKEERLVLEFLSGSRTKTKAEAETIVAQQEQVKRSAGQRLSTLQSAAESLRGEVGVVRDLVLQAREELGQLQQQRRDLELERTEQSRLLSRLRTRESEVERAASASDILGPIEFVVCPRCAQSIKSRPHAHGTCQLCLQTEPMPDALLARRSAHEINNVAAQVEEVETLLSSSELERAVLSERENVARDNLMKLETVLDDRTRHFVSPRLEQYADAAAELARAEALLGSMDDLLRLWDRATDLELARSQADEALVQLAGARKAAEDALRGVRRHLLNTLSNDYHEMVQRLAVPTVTDAHIDQRNYLPFANGDRFDRISTGGITTALVTAYWLTVLATALRERETNYPSLLIIDTPRKSIGSRNAQMADELYRQLDTLAAANGDRMQVIVADNDIPNDISKTWQDLRFDYDNPTVWTIAHPGPANVTTLDAD